MQKQSKMKTYLEFINEKKKEEYGCLMVYPELSGWSDFVKNIVKEEDLYKPEDKTKGYEKEPHITILYGFHEKKNIIDEIKSLLIPIKDLDDIVMSDISVFKNDDYDVVKVNIQSKKLKKLNKLMKENFKYTTDFEDYNPHMTVAFVKKGEGSKYKQKLKDKKVKPKKYVYSTAKRVQTTINESLLKGETNSAVLAYKHSNLSIGEYLKKRIKEEYDEFMEEYKYISKSPKQHKDVLNHLQSEWMERNIDLKTEFKDILSTIIFEETDDIFIKGLEENPEFYINFKDFFDWLKVDKNKIPDWIKRGNKSGLLDIKR